MRVVDIFTVSVSQWYELSENLQYSVYTHNISTARHSSYQQQVGKLCRKNNTDSQLWLNNINSSPCCGNHFRTRVLFDRAKSDGISSKKPGYQQVYLPVYNKYNLTLISKNLGYESCTWDEVFQYKSLQRKCWARSCIHWVFVLFIAVFSGFLKSKRLAWGFNKSCSHRWAQVIIALYYTPLCMQ